MSIHNETPAPYGGRIPLVKQICWYWLPVALYAGCIVYISSLSSLPQTLPLRLEHVSDKIWHAVEYGVLGILVYRALFYAAGSRLRVIAFPLAILAASIFGLTDELHQWFVPNRQADAWDLFADTLGATAAVGLWSRVMPFASDAVVWQDKSIFLLDGRNEVAGRARTRK